MKEKLGGFHSAQILLYSVDFAEFEKCLTEGDWDNTLIDAGMKKVALLGTKYTMTQDFYKDRLIEKGLTVIIPEENEMEQVNDVIFNELCKGIISDRSRNLNKEIIEHMKEKGAEGVILGCTEIGLLISEEDSSLPVFDTTQIHARLVAQKAMEEFL